MDRMEEMRDYMKTKKGSYSDYKRKKKENREVEKMQELLHKYFDLKGLYMSKEDIAKVNKYLQEQVVLDDEYEVGRFLTLMDNFTTLNGGLEALKADRAQVLERMNRGQVVSKSDACIVAKKVIVFLKQIVNFNYNDKGTKVEHIVRPQKAYQLAIDPEAKQPMVKSAFTSELDKFVRAFQEVKACAFQSSKVSQS